jgi:hypothetical protein
MTAIRLASLLISSLFYYALAFGAHKNLEEWWASLKSGPVEKGAGDVVLAPTPRKGLGAFLEAVFLVEGDAGFVDFEDGVDQVVIWERLVDVFHDLTSDPFALIGRV